jgi:PAS domain S-box-containing protein
MDNILIIEDDLSLRESTADFLREEGFNVLEAGNGSEGVKIAIEQKPALVLCDISMPEMNGYEVLQTLQKHETASVIPFIFFTAKTEKDDIRIGMQLGADDYITKPFDFDELLSAVKIRIDKFKKIKKINLDKFNLVYENSLFGMAILSNGEIVNPNTKFLSMLGYLHEDLAGKSIFSLIPESEKERIAPKFEKCMLGAVKKFKEKCYFLNKAKESILVRFFTVHLNGESNNSECLIIVSKEEIAENIEAVQGILNDDVLGSMVNYLVTNKQRLSKEQLDELTGLLLKKKIPVNFQSNLTNRETDVLLLICKGLTNQQISDKLNISIRTVETHRANLLEKTESSNTAELIVFALKNNLADL